MLLILTNVPTFDVCLRCSFSWFRSITWCLYIPDTDAVNALLIPGKKSAWAKEFRLQKAVVDSMRMHARSFLPVSWVNIGPYTECFRLILHLKKLCNSYFDGNMAIKQYVCELIFRKKGLIIMTILTKFHAYYKTT